MNLIKMADDGYGDSISDRHSEISPPSAIFIELDIGSQSDCAIRSINASKPYGLDIELQPVTQRWQNRTGTNPHTKPTLGICNTCSRPCTTCWPPQPPTKRFLSCAYVDLPSLKTHRITVDIPTANTEGNNGFADKSLPLTTSDVSTQTDGFPGRISNLSVAHNSSTSVDVTLKIDKELGLFNGGPELSSRSSSGVIDMVTDDHDAHDGRDGLDDEDTLDQCSSYSSSDDLNETKVWSSTIRPLDKKDVVAIDSDQEEDELYAENVQAANEMFQQSEPDLFEMTEEEEDHLMRMNAVFAGAPVLTPLEPKPFPLIHDAMYQSEPTDEDPQIQTESDWSIFQTGSLDMTEDEFEQYMAMNAAFGSPAVIPPPKSVRLKMQSSQEGSIEHQLSLQRTDSWTDHDVPAPPLINLTDSLDLTPEEYEQFVAMNAAFGGPSVIPPPRLTPQTKTPITRPSTLDIQPAETIDDDKTPSPASPNISRKSAISYQCNNDPTLNDESKQYPPAELTGNELDNDKEKDYSDEEDDASLVASSQEDEGSLTPTLGGRSLSFDTGSITDESPAKPTTNRTPKGPEFIEELSLSAASSGSGYGDNSVLMRCKIEAWPHATVSWFYKDEPLGDGDQAVDPDRIELKPDQASGIYTLLLKEVESFDTGVYTCKASNSIGEATSGAELIVQEAVSDSEYETARSYFTSGDEIVDGVVESWLSRDWGVGGRGNKMIPERTVRITTHGATAARFTFKPQSRVVEIGQTARLICGVKGSPKPQVSWFTHGMELRNEGRYRVFESEEPGNFVLEIREIKPTDAGTYTCTAGNIIGQVYCSSQLSVEDFGEPEVDCRKATEEMTSLPVQYLQYGPDVPDKEEEVPPPEEETQPPVPQKLFSTENTDAKLHCSKTGYEALDITWYKDGKALTSDDHTIISIETDNTILTLCKTQLQDGGEYTCCLTDPPHTQLCCCVLVVKEAEASADDRSHTPGSLTPIPTAPEIILSEVDDSGNLVLNQTDGPEDTAPAQCDPQPDVESTGAKQEPSNELDDSKVTRSYNQTTEGSKVKVTDKHSHVSPRKLKEIRKSRKISRGNRHSAHTTQHVYLKYDSTDSDSSSDNACRKRRERTPTRKSKTRKKRNSHSSDIDEEFDTDLQRVMAMSDRADACLNIVNSVLEMTSLDKSVDETIQEQIFALQPNEPEVEDTTPHNDDRENIIVDSDHDVELIKQVAAQRVSSAIAAHMMREANTVPTDPSPNEDLLQMNGLQTDAPTMQDCFELEDDETSAEVAQVLSECSQEEASPVCYTTSAQFQVSIPIVQNGPTDASQQLSPNIDTPVETAPPVSPRTCLFRGPQDQIFTLDEMIDALPETAVDESPNQNSDSVSAEDEETQKFTPLEFAESRNSSLEEPSPTDSPIQDTRLEDSPPKLLTLLQDTFVLEGDAMRLEVQLEGSPVPDVKWDRDHEELLPGKNIQLRLDGDDTWALIIRNVSTKDGGLYTCTATNTVGITSTSAFITVAGLVDGPEATTGDDEEELTADDSLLSPVIPVTSPTSPLEDDVFMDRFRDDLPRILLNAQETNIDDITPSQSDQEDLQDLTVHLTEALCLDRNSNWADESSPDVSRSNSNNSDRGAPFHFQKRNRPDSNIETIRHRKAIRKNRRWDSVTSTEPCSTGNSTSESDTEGAPKFLKPLQTTEILEGESVQFEVCVTGDPEPKVRWFHDGSELRRTSQLECNKDEDSKIRYTWRLTISNVRPQDDGKYVCKVENEAGIKSCFAFLIVEALNVNEGAVKDEDKRIVSRLLKEREDDTSVDESSQVEEDLLRTFTVESDYSDSSGRMAVKKGDQVELLDGRKKDRWLVRHKTNDNMIGYIPCSLLKRSPSQSSDREDKKIIYNFVSKQNNDRPFSNSLKLKPRVIRHLSLREAQLSELDEDKMIEDFSDAEVPQSYDLYMAVASYTPSSEQKGFISMAENQVFEVLDSNSALNWLVRGESSHGNVGWVPASYLTPYVNSGLNSLRRGSRSIWDDHCEVEVEEEDAEGVREVGSKVREAMTKRGYVLKELLDTERDYVKDLKYVVTHFIPPIQHPNVPPGLKGKKDDIFCNIKEIYEFHNSKFLHELEECENDANSIGRAFIKWQSTFMALHVLYCKNKPKADTVLTPAAKAFFLQYGGGTGPGELGLGDYLIKPVQRITKYQLLLKEIIKYTSRAKEDCQELEFAMNGMIEVPKRANDLMYLDLIEGFQRDVTDLGKLYRQDSFSAWSGKPKGRGKERHLFLFKDILLFTKPKKEVKGDVVGYIYKSHSMVGAVTVTEDQADERRFELSQGRSSPITLLAKTKYVKEAWVKALRDLIAEVPKDLIEGKLSTERRLDQSPIIRKRRATSMLSSGSSMTSLLSEPGINLNGNFSKSTESLMSIMSSPSLLSVPRSGRGSIDSMMASVDLSAFTALVPSIGATYVAVEDLIADSDTTIDILKGDTVKLLDVCDNNLFHIQTIPTDEEGPRIEGYVPPGLLKKMGSNEEPPVFTERVKSCLVSPDDSATLTCSFTGKPYPSATWSMPNHLSNDNKRVDIMNTDDTSILTISNITMLDAGDYTCTVENASGSVSCTAKLDVKGPHSPSLSLVDPKTEGTQDIPQASSPSPVPLIQSPLGEISMVRSTSLENLKSLDEDFDVFPGEIVRASSVSGRGMLNSKRLSGMDKIGSFRKHFKKAFSSVGAEKDKILHNFQRSQSGGSLIKSKHQQRPAICVHGKAMKDDNGDDIICEACIQRALSGSRETLLEEEENSSQR